MEASIIYTNDIGKCTYIHYDSLKKHDYYTNRFLNEIVNNEYDSKEIHRARDTL